MYLILLILFIIFQVIYIAVPLLKEKPRNNLKSILEKEQKGLTVLVPAYNEELVVEKCIKSMVNVNYQNHEVIIINDGSTDLTMELLSQMLELEGEERVCQGKLDYKQVKGFYHSRKYHNIYVIDKYNGGKADSLNAGIDYSGHDIVITLDADSVLEKNSLMYINQGFDEQNVIAIGGLVHIIQGFEKHGNGYKPSLKHANALVKHQIIQYLCGFCLNKYTHSCFNAITVIAGAFGAFRKEVLFNVDGFRQTVGEDMDITLKVQKYMKQNNKKEKMTFMPEAICYTQCPSDLKNLFNQRFRWQRAFIDCVIYYWDDLFKNFSFLTSMYLLFDSFILGTLVSFSVIMIPLLILLSPKMGILALVSMLVTAAITGLLQDLVVLIVLRRYGYRYTVSGYLKFIGFALYECMTLRFFGIIYAVFGSMSYFVNTHGWKKIDRIELDTESSKL
ncbi:MAG: glycosyltransferase [Cellulosilyticaceae bacterium]